MKDVGVYAVDDDPVVLNSLEALLSLNDFKVQSFTNAQDFLDNADLHSPGCVISDVMMPGISGPELLLRLNNAESTLSMIVVSGVADVPTTVTLMENGAVTLLEKPYDQSALIQAVNRALVASRQAWSHQQDKKAIQERLSTLTGEEQEVLRLLLAGEPNKAVSSKLNLSMRTVDRRRQSILLKMEVESLTGLALMVGTLSNGQSL